MKFRTYQQADGIRGHVSGCTAPSKRYVPTISCLELQRSPSFQVTCKTSGQNSYANQVPQDTSELL